MMSNRWRNKLNSVSRNRTSRRKALKSVCCSLHSRRALPLNKSEQNIAGYWTANGYLKMFGKICELFLDVSASFNRIGYFDAFKSQNLLCFSIFFSPRSESLHLNRTIFNEIGLILKMFLLTFELFLDVSSSALKPCHWLFGSFSCHAYIVLQRFYWVKKWIAYVDVVI